MRRNTERRLYDLEQSEQELAGDEDTPADRVAALEARVAAPENA